MADVVAEAASLAFFSAFDLGFDVPALESFAAPLVCLAVDAGGALADPFAALAIVTVGRCAVVVAATCVKSQ